MEGGELVGQLEVPRRGQGVLAARHPGLEEVGGVGPHLVEVGHHVGPPPVELLEAGSGLGLLRQEPVAVEIEPVVVGAAVGPGLAVLAVPAVGDQHPAAVHVGPLGEPPQAVGVERRVEDDHRLGEQALDRLPPRRRQVVGDEKRRVRAARLVAVDAVAEVDHHRHAGGAGLTRRRIGEPPVRGEDLVEPRQVLGRRDREVEERPLLVGAADGLDRHPLGARGEGLHVGDQLVVAHVPLADLEA